MCCREKLERVFALRGRRPRGRGSALESGQRSLRIGAVIELVARVERFLRRELRDVLGLDLSRELPIALDRRVRVPEEIALVEDKQELGAVRVESLN